jgi:hypothetical protein
MIPLADIDLVWPSIAAVAEEMLVDDLYGPEEIKAACREGRALCFANEDGVMVATLTANPAKKDNELCVWLAVSLRAAGGVTRDYLPAIESLAGQLGARRVVFHTRRRGWQRLLDCRWRLRSTTYVMDLSDG